jgi:hypothetical protein
MLLYAVTFTDLPDKTVALVLLYTNRSVTCCYQQKRDHKRHEINSKVHVNSHLLEISLRWQAQKVLINTLQKLKQEAEKYGLVIKQNKIHEALKNTKLCEGYGNRNRMNEH